MGTEPLEPSLTDYACLRGFADGVFSLERGPLFIHSHDWSIKRGDGPDRTNYRARRGWALTKGDQRRCGEQKAQHPESRS